MLPNPIPTVLRSFCLENERDDRGSALHASGLILLRFKVQGPKKIQSAEVSAEEVSGKVSGLLNACLVAAKACDSNDDNGADRISMLQQGCQ